MGSIPTSSTITKQDKALREVSSEFSTGLQTLGHETVTMALHYSRLASVLISASSWGLSPAAGASKFRYSKLRVSTGKHRR